MNGRKRKTPAKKPPSAPPPSPEPDEGEAPDLSDLTHVREYSDLVMYYVKSGRFQHHPLMDENRRMGALTLLKPHRVTKLTKERRLRPVALTLTRGEPEQRVYLFSIVRSSVSNEELEDYVTRLNDSLSGLTTAEKEAFVIELIHNSPARVRPGVRNLPADMYAGAESAPPESNVDDEGLSALPSEDEIVVARNRQGAAKKKGDISLPSTTANLPEPHTDSEKSSKSSGSTKRKTPDSDTSSVQVLTEAEEPQSKKRKSGDEITQEDYELEEVDHGDVIFEGDDNASQGEEDVELDIPDEVEVRKQEDVSPPTRIEPPRGGPDSTSSTVATFTGSEFMDMFREEAVTKSEFTREMETVTTGLGELKRLLTALVSFQTGQSDLGELAAASGNTVPEAAMKIRLPQNVQRATRSASSEPDPMFNDAEARLYALFPINHYTEPMAWLLTQAPVQRFLECMTIRKCYLGTSLPGKPDFEVVLYKFFKYVCSTRLRAHLGKSTGGAGSGGQNLDFGRFPLPKAIEDIANERLPHLHKVKVPGQRSSADFFKDKAGAAKRNNLIGSAYVSQKSKSVQEVAQRLYWERMQFFEMHEHMFPSVEPASWNFKKELAKAKKLACCKKKPDDPNFKFSVMAPPNLEDLVFPRMSKGTPLLSMDEARALVEDLKKAGVNKPLLPEPAWRLINTQVHPGDEELAEIEQRVASKKATHEKRLGRRRQRYQESHGQRTHVDSDDDDDDEGDPEGEDDPDDQEEEDQEQDTEGPDQGEPVHLGVQSEVPNEQTRDQQVRELFGSVSDITTSSDSAKVGTTVKEGQIVFSVPEGMEGELELDVVHEAGGGKVIASGPEASTAPTNEFAIVSHLRTTDLLAQAIQQGIGGPGEEMTVTASGSTETAASYSVTAAEPGDKTPVVVAGTSHATRTTEETLSKPAGKAISGKVRSAMQKYADMEETLPQFSSSSSSSSSDAGKQKQGTEEKRRPEKRPSDDSDITKKILAGMGPPSSPAWQAQAKRPSRSAGTQEKKDSAKSGKPGDGPSTSKGKGKGTGKHSKKK